tara:strand:- start:1000 stop:1215 length:216 start_codon:yes stop_codon:yes gene_type:complete
MTYSDNIPKKEAARLVGCSESSIMRHVKNANCPLPYRIGGRVYFSKREILAWIDEIKRNNRIIPQNVKRTQ